MKQIFYFRVIDYINIDFTIEKSEIYLQMIISKSIASKGVLVFSLIAMSFLSCGKQVSNVSEANPWKKNGINRKKHSTNALFRQDL